MRYVSRGHSAVGLSRVKVGCPRNLHVTGGGGALGKPATSTLIASFPVDGSDANSKPDDGWEAWGNAGEADNLQAFAACTKTMPAYHRAVMTVKPAEGLRISAQCAGGQHVLGVGGRIGSAPAGTARVQLADPDDLNHDGVYDEAGAIFAINDVDAPSPENGIAYAICKR
jgi:hypothetical protein